MASIANQLQRFEDAVRAHAFKGAGHPEDVPGIEREYEAAKADLHTHVERLIERGYRSGNRDTIQATSTRRHQMGQ